MALKLVELGPRLQLKLYKVERLLSGGDVMYHPYVSKTPTEVAALKKRKDGEASLKKRRREEQEGNVERKKRVKDEKRDAREGRRKEREYRAMAALRGECGGSVGVDDDGSDDGNSDDGNGKEEDGGSESGDGDDADNASGSEDKGNRRVARESRHMPMLAAHAHWMMKRKFLLHVILCSRNKFIFS